MNIIFGKEMAEKLSDRYTLLELDTVMQPGMSEPITLFAVIERVTLEDIPNLENLKELHRQLMFHYKKGEWNYIEDAVTPLMGHWQNELNSFYESVVEFSRSMEGKSWDGIRHTVPVDTDDSTS
jgi:hypothetical protein